MTVLSDISRTNMFAEETGDGLLILLTIDHSSLSSPIRVTHNTVNISSRGDDFIAFPFDLALPTNDSDSPPRAQLVIDNVSREIGQVLRQITSTASVLIEVVQLLDPDVLEFSFPELNLINIRLDVAKVTGDLVSEDLQVTSYPTHTFSPAEFPGLF